MPFVCPAILTGTSPHQNFPARTFKTSVREIPRIHQAHRRTSTVCTGIRHATECGMERIRIEQHSWTGTVWAFGWLFTIGYLHLTFWKGVLAILLWPYYLGVAISALAAH